MDTWERLWARLSYEQRKVAAYENLVQGAKLPMAESAILKYLAKETRSSLDAVGRWSLL